MRRSADRVVKKLPTLHIGEIRDLPPMVEMDLNMSDEDYRTLLRMAYPSLRQDEVDKLVLGEFLRRALIESLKRLPGKRTRREAAP